MLSIRSPRCCMFTRLAGLKLDSIVMLSKPFVVLVVVCLAAASPAAAAPRRKKSASAEPQVRVPNSGTSVEPNAVRGLEVGGLKLGMSLDQVRAALAIHDPKLKELNEVRRFPNGHEVDNATRDLSATFVSEISTDSVLGTVGSRVEFRVAFSPPPLPARAVSIYRFIRYSPPEAPSLENVKNALADKYPSCATPLEGCAWKADGTPVGAPAVADVRFEIPCNAALVSYALMPHEGLRGLPRPTGNSCGTYLHAVAQGETLAVRVVDVNGWMKATSAAVSEIENEQKAREAIGSNRRCVVPARHRVMRVSK